MVQNTSKTFLLVENSNKKKASIALNHFAIVKIVLTYSILQIHSNEPIPQHGFPDLNDREYPGDKLLLF